MNTYAAVMTGKGTGAISTIQLFGDSAEAVINKIFKPTGTKSAVFEPGKILLGTINKAGETIDQVTIGCEAIDSFAIHCHGNPLIVEMIMQLLQHCGAKLVTAEELLAKMLAAQKPMSTIALEAKLAQLKAKTIQGTKIIANQIDAGLSKKVTEWLGNINDMSLDQIAAEAEQILKSSQTTKLIILGCKAAIIGPPNTGKSTLLNCLAGRQKAIVTDIKGTTRDWVSATCKIEPLSIEFFDTAGLDEKSPTPKDTIEKAAQQKSVEILEQADLVLLVLDYNQTIDQLDGLLLADKNISHELTRTSTNKRKTLVKISENSWLKKLAGKKVLTVLNKSDLPTALDTAKLPKNLNKIVQISAKAGTGIENLAKKIRQVLGVEEFDLKTIVCFTRRQENLLKKLKKVQSRQQTASIIKELLNGHL